MSKRAAEDHEDEKKSKKSVSVSLCPQIFWWNDWLECYRPKLEDEEESGSEDEGSGEEISDDDIDEGTFFIS